jgi:hypothetical protein
MTHSSPYIHALRSAAKIVGDEAKLSELLRVPREDLSRWLCGASLPTLEGYVRALDILWVDQVQQCWPKHER